MTYFLNSNMEYFVHNAHKQKILESKLGENWYFSVVLHHLQDEDIDKIPFFFLHRVRKLRDRDKEKEHHVSWRAVSRKLWVFDPVPDCPEYRNRRKTTVIQCCEKANRFNVKIICSLITRIEESKHNPVISECLVPNYRQWAIEKPKSYRRN